MNAKYPILPIAGGASLRAFVGLLALVVDWFKRLWRARRHRHEATVLASLSCSMLADIGLTRADVRDAFSEPFWEDPTARLHERVCERRINRTSVCKRDAGVENGFYRPRTDRPSRQAL